MTLPTTATESRADAAEDLLDGRYLLTGLLHRAEATDTWRAHDCRLGREVVIELLYAPGETVSNPDQLQATLNERYSHLAHVYDAGSVDGPGSVNGPRSHPRPGGSCTFVVTTLLVNPPLPVGHWQLPGGSHRRPRAWRFPKPAARAGRR